MTDEERLQRVRDLRQWAKEGRDVALSRGPVWSDYGYVLQVAQAMEAEACELAELVRSLHDNAI